MNTREKLIDRLPVDDAILILREELKQSSDGYATHLSYGGKGDPAEEVHIDALEMAISALEQTKWISVTERLPDDDSHVLAYLRIGEEGRIYPASYAKGVWWDCIFGTPTTKTTTHWMPLPTPPEGE